VRNNNGFESMGELNYYRSVLCWSEFYVDGKGGGDDLWSGREGVVSIN